MKRISIFCTCLFFSCINEAATEKTFTITTEQFAPFIGKQLNENGWLMEVAKSILEPQGYSVKLNFRPWARAMHESKAGKYDGLYLAYYTKEREQWFIFSKPVGKVRTGVTIQRPLQ